MPDNASRHFCLYQKPAVAIVLAISLPRTCLFPTACYAATAPGTIGASLARARLSERESGTLQ